MKRQCPCAAETETKRPRTPTRALVLFKGTGSVDRVLEAMGYDVVSVDWNPRFKPTLVADVMELDFRNIWTAGDFDIVWASPDCTQFSKAKTDGKRDLAKGCALVQRTIDIIEHLNPRMWFFENPATGLLPKQSVVAGIPYFTADYCCYWDDRLQSLMPYRKRTAFWTNASPRLGKCRGVGRCPMMEKRHHVGSCGNGHSTYNRNGRSSQIDKFIIPSTLVRILLESDVGNLAFVSPNSFKT